MATILLSLSSKEDKITHRSEVLLRFLPFHGLNLRSKMGIFIYPHLFRYFVSRTASQKAGVIIPRIPLNKTAISLINKYKGTDEKGRLFPFISPDKYNEAIRKILLICGITRNVQVRNSTTGETEIKRICDVASSHMARRAFVGAAYKVVKDPNIVGKMSGHVEGSRAFNRYRQIGDDILRETINEI
ncbi:MAG: hypothetical protein LKE41_09775 [Prevotella sp.]|jgi:hypothetical protein|nr:hypothetical protein [Prevotella sp.]